MTVYTAQGHMKMVWRKYQCLIYASQDGVCGCPQFWERKASPPAPTNRTTTSAQKNDKARLGATTTSRSRFNDKDRNGVETSCENSKFDGPTRETCFFWYHGTCHRGNDCSFAHESHFTWPITPPPGYVHFEACDLPLCPLRKDLAVLMEDSRRGKSVWRSPLDGQLDGAAASFLSGNAPSEGTSSDTSNANIGDQAHNENMDIDATSIQSLIDPSSRPLDESYSDSDSSEVGKSEEDDDATNAEQQQTNSNDVASSPPQLDDMDDYFDLFGYKPLSPSSDIDEPVILSLSHPGTLRKRGSESVSSPNREDSERKRPKIEGKQGQGDASRQLKELTRGPITVKTKHTANAMDIANGHANPPQFSFGLLHQFPPKPEPTASGLLFINMQRPTPPQPQPSIPTGPRALGGGAPVCFYWYHKGYCNPKTRKNGQLIKCIYAHSLDGPRPQVSLPPNITDHDPFCPLPLCPVIRIEPLPYHADRSNAAADKLRTAGDRHWDKSKKSGGSDVRHRSKPRETILGRHVVTHARDNGSKNMQKLLVLSGANSESVRRNRRNPHHKHQKDKSGNMRSMNRHRDGKKLAAAPMKKHGQKVDTYRRLKNEASVLDYGDDVSQDQQADSSAISADCDSVDDGGCSFLEQLSTELSRPHWMNTVQLVADGLGGHTNGTRGEEGSSLQTPSHSDTKVPVDQTSSVSEPRLDWDTDEVRRLFGEIS